MADNRIILNMANPSEAQNGHFAFINLIQGVSGLSSRAFALPRFSSYLGANGVPSTSPPDSSISTLLNVPASYSGQYVVKWTGTQTFQLETNDSPMTSVGDPGSVVVSNSSGTMQLAGTNGRVTFNISGTAGAWLFRFLPGTYTTPGVPALMFAANETAYDAGEIFNPDFITALKTLNPKAIRMVKWGGLTFYSQPLTLGRPQSYLNYGGNYFPPGLYAGDISSSNNATFTCAAAPSTPGSITEGELIYGWATATNTGASTLNVGGRGAKPIISENTGAALDGDPAHGGLISSGTLVSFAYDAILDSYWYIASSTNEGFVEAGVSLSVMIALCNKVGCGLWYCLPALTKVSEFRVIADYIRDNLNGTAWIEYSNELWGGAPSTPNGMLKLWSDILFPTDHGYGNPQALRSRQIHGDFTDSWNAASRPLSTLKRVVANLDGGSPLGGGGFLSHIMEGASLGSYGYSTAPNRPIDFMDVLALNIYINGPNSPAFDNTVSYVATGQEALYSAADDFASGDPTRMSNALEFIHQDILQGTGGNTVGVDDTIKFKRETLWPNWETGVASYDGSRSVPIEVVAYEGGLQILAASVATLNSLGLNGSLYGSVYTPTHTAGLIEQLFIGYKNDDRCKQLILKLYGDFIAKPAQAHATTPAWFQCIGSTGQWDLYPNDLYSTPYKSFDAIVQWDLARSVPHLRFRLHA